MKLVEVVFTTLGNLALNTALAYYGWNFGLCEGIPALQPIGWSAAYLLSVALTMRWKVSVKI